MNKFHPFHSKTTRSRFVEGDALETVTFANVMYVTAALLFQPVNLFALFSDSQLTGQDALDVDRPIHSIKITELVIRHRGDLVKIDRDLTIPCGMPYYDNKSVEHELGEDKFSVSLSFIAHENGDVVPGFSLNVTEWNEGEAPVIEVVGYVMEFYQLPKPVETAAEQA